jgi:hypothetical protein
MSLLRLLTAGKSLVGAKEVARYREADPKSMPKFGGKPHPFRVNGDAAPAVGAEPPAETAPLVASASAGVPAEKASQGDARSGPLTRWLWWRRPKAAAVPRFHKPLVQAELSLDRVKPLRNDLSDCDLEVIPARSAGTQKSAELGQKGTTTNVAEQATEGVAQSK